MDGNELLAFIATEAKYVAAKCYGTQGGVAFRAAWFTAFVVRKKKKKKKGSMEASLSAFWVCGGASGGGSSHCFASETDRGDHGECEAGEKEYRNP